MSLPAAAAISTACSAAPRTHRRRRSFWVSTACLAIGLMVWSMFYGASFDAHDDQPGYLDALLVWDLLIGVVACSAVGPMHRAGRWNLLLIVASGFSGFATPAAAVAALRLGARRHRAETLLVVLLSVVCQAGISTLVLAPVDGFDWYDLVSVPLVGATTWGFIMWGRSRADHEALIASLREQAASATRERAAIERERLALADTRASELARIRSDERTAIARDMHDSLSHHLSLIAMHAGALAYRDDLPPERVRAAARTLRDAAEAANTDLRGVLAALRTDTTTDPVSQPSTAPLPTSRSIARVVEDARAAGQRIDIELDGVTDDDLTRLPGATTASLHRIVSELVVNARKHAPEATLTLSFSRRDDNVVITATNPAITPSDALGTGLGLVGVTERARLLGGDARHDHSTDFTVEVRIPWLR